MWSIIRAGGCGDRRLRALQETALLVLLSRSARAWIVPSDLLAGSRARLSAGGGTSRRGPCLAVSSFLPSRCHGDRGSRLPHGFLPARSHLEELLHDHFLQVIDHLLEHLEGFLLVFDQRVSLPVSAKADAFLEVVHV